MSPTNCQCSHASISHRIQDGVSLCTQCGCEEYIPNIEVKLPEISETDAGIFTRSVRELEEMKPTPEEKAKLIKSAWNYMFSTKKAHEMNERELINFYAEIQYCYQHLSSMVEARGVKITREKIARTAVKSEEHKKENAAKAFANAAKKTPEARAEARVEKRKLSKLQKMADTLRIPGYLSMNDAELKLAIRKEMS